VRNLNKIKNIVTVTLGLLLLCSTTARAETFFGRVSGSPDLKSLNFVSYVDNELANPIIDGALIKRPGESEIYVVEGKYKRYLRTEIIALYGHLDASKAIELDDKTFNSYSTANYVRVVNDKKIYAVWPDATKHWLNMSGQYFTESGRDWGAIFTINESEFSAYKIGAEINK